MAEITYKDSSLLATQFENGIMSSNDKRKLDTISFDGYATLNDIRNFSGLPIVRGPYVTGPLSSLSLITLLRFIDLNIPSGNKATISISVYGYTGTIIGINRNVKFVVSNIDGYVSSPIFLFGQDITSNLTEETLSGWTVKIDLSIDGVEIFGLSPESSSSWRILYEISDVIPLSGAGISDPYPEVNLTVPASVDSETVPLVWMSTISIDGWYISQSSFFPENTSWQNSAPNSFILTGSGSQNMYYWGRGALGATSRKQVTTIVTGAAPPIISSINYSTSLNSAAITWTTDKLSDSTIEYGTTIGYGSSSTIQTLVTDHTVILSNLTPNTLYYFRVSSKIGTGDPAVSDGYTFSTLEEAQIAYESSIPVNLASSQTTVQYTANGPLIFVGVSCQSDTPPTITWNGHSLTFIDFISSGWGDRAYLYYIAGSDVGTHDLTITIPTASGHAQVASYAGTSNNSSVISSSATVAGVSPITLTNTVTDSRAWLVGFVASGDSTFSAGAGTTIRGTPNAFCAIGDSNGAVGTGSQSLIFNGGAGGQVSGVIVSIIPGDAAAPLITGVSSYAQEDSMTFTWTTDENSTSEVGYGPNLSYDGYIIDSTLTMIHEVIVPNLQPDTIYHFRVQSRDAAGNVRMTSDYALSTTLPDTIPPEIFDVSAGPMTDRKATITWVTNEPATSYIEYGLTVEYGISAGSQTLTTNHSVVISGLTASTTYHYRVITQDAKGNQSTSNDHTLTTQPVDMIAPIISNITTSEAYASASISWITDEEATSYVEFGTTTAYGSSYSSAELTTSHTLNIGGLNPNTIYHYRVRSLDFNGNIRFSSDATFQTPTSAMLAYTPQGIGGGGAMTSLSFSPFDENLWFVATDMGSLFRSYDAGTTWTPNDQLQIIYNANLDRSVPLGFCADPNIVFFSNAGKDPMRSIDKGLNWSAIPINLAVTERIRYWVPDTTDENVILCATDQRLLRTSNKGLTWSALSISGVSRGTFIDHVAGDLYHATLSGIYVSHDNGITFELYAAPETLPLRAFTGGRDSNGLTLVYIDGDGYNAVGPWIRQLVSITEATEAQYNNAVATSGFVWVKTTGDSSFHRVNYSRTYSGISYVSTYLYAGAEIKPAMQTVFNLTADGYNLGGIYMAENNSQIIYTTGNVFFPRMYGTDTVVSVNAGLTWERRFILADADIDYAPWPADKLEWNPIGMSGRWWDSYYTSFAVNQLNANVAGGTGYMFLEVTKDAGQTWKAPFTRFMDTGERATYKKWQSTGLEVTSVNCIRIHPNNPLLMYIGMADIGGYMSSDGGQTVQMMGMSQNTNYDFAFDTSNDQIVYVAASALHDWPQMVRAIVTSAGGIYRSNNRGETWTRLTPNNAEFSTSFLSVAYDTARNIIYGGTQGSGIARSTDGGSTWNWFNTGIVAGNGRIISRLFTDGYGNVYALLAGDFNYTNITNMAQTGIYFLDVQNNSTTWQLLRTTLHLPAGDSNEAHYWNYPIACAVDPNNSDILWLADIEYNWGCGGIWKSTDRGQNWYFQIQVRLPNDLAIDPVNSDNVYVTSDFQIDGGWENGGIMYTGDGGTTWMVHNRVPHKIAASAVNVDRVDTSQIWFGFHGAGLLHGPKPDPNVVNPTVPGSIFGTVVGNTIQLSWAASTSDVPIKGYAIRRSYNDGTFHEKAVTFASADNRTFIDTDVVAGNSYRYTIRAEDESGDLSDFGQSSLISV